MSDVAALDEEQAQGVVEARFPIDNLQGGFGFRLFQVPLEQIRRWWSMESRRACGAVGRTGSEGDVGLLGQEDDPVGSVLGEVSAVDSAPEPQRGAGLASGL